MEFPIHLLILFPLLGAILSIVLGRRLGVRLVGALASLMVLLSFAAGSFLFSRLLAAEEGAMFTDRAFEWISSEYLRVGFDLMIDPLSAVMTLVITGVGFLIHVYSIGYMGHDPGYPRFFALLNLFVSAMLVLVLGGNLIVTFLGWEGVGLCSYGLIGFWFNDEAKAAAGKKAFIVNRIGDFGFLVAVFLTYAHFNTLDYIELKAACAGALAGTTAPILVSIATAIILMLFMGAMGKSAQLPLHVWLPDAMAGPTPVSALIHAATMVTAGVYLMSRMSFMRPFAESAYLFIGGIGVLTALMAALIALGQRDIKKILAYSTVSQLGYMFLAVGVGAPIAGVFHLVTHAFFKALLFLGAGSVIHAMHEEQDVFEMGGLLRSIPITGVTMAVGVLAIAGIPPLSGFVSKDEILFLTLANGHSVLYGIALFTALLTSFYMGRLFFLTFWGEKRGAAKRLESIHESPFVMTFALIVLAVLSAVAGFVAWPEAFGGHNQFHHFLSSVVFERPHGVGGADGHGNAVALAVLSSLLGLLGLTAAYVWTQRFSNQSRLHWVRSGGILSNVVLNRFYFDEIYDLVVVRNLRRVSNLLFEAGDVAAIDGAVNGTGRVIGWGGRLGSRLQNGVVQFYGLVLLIGAAGVLIFLFLEL